MSQNTHPTIQSEHDLCSGCTLIHTRILRLWRPYTIIVCAVSHSPVALLSFMQRPRYGACPRWLSSSRSCCGFPSNATSSVRCMSAMTLQLTAVLCVFPSSQRHRFSECSQWPSSQTAHGPMVFSRRFNVLGPVHLFSAALPE